MESESSTGPAWEQLFSGVFWFSQNYDDHDCDGNLFYVLIMVTKIVTRVPGYDYDGHKDPNGKRFWF